MSLPTSFPTKYINYGISVHANNSPYDDFSIGLSLRMLTDNEIFNEAFTEAIQAAIETGLQSVADEIDAVTGVSGVEIYRSYSAGESTSSDIRS